MPKTFDVRYSDRVTHYLPRVKPNERLNLAGQDGIEIGPSRDGCVTRQWANSLVRRGMARIVREGDTERLVSNQLDLFPTDWA